MSRSEWVIPASAGITDYNGLPRMTTVRRVNGEVLLYASTAANEDLADGSTCIRMSNEAATQLGFILQSAAETNRQLGEGA